MKNLIKKISFVGLASGVVVGAMITFGLLGASSIFSQQIPDALPEATVVVDGFHWGWVPQILDPGPGVTVDITPGAQGSQIIVPKDTNITLILRNVAGNPELHETFENRYRDFFTNKYGEAWMGTHQASHDDSMESEETEHDESESIKNNAEEDPQLIHSFFLEGYGLDITLPANPESNLKIVRFVADKVGEFRFVCTNFCGLGHGDMRGTLVVQ